MEKIKEFLNNKINIFAVVLITSALLFGGYKAYIAANGDDVCIQDTKTITKNYEVLKDQVAIQCSNISWGNWKKEGKKEVRYGTGTKTIIDYRYKQWAKTNINVTTKTWVNTARCNNGARLDTVVKTKTIKTGEKIDKDLRNDKKAKVYYTNMICEVKQTKNNPNPNPNPNPDPECSEKDWFPASSTRCTGIYFTQESNCENTRVVEGTKLGCGCSNKNWTPAKNTVCEGNILTQIDSNGCKKEVEGTKNCDSIIEIGNDDGMIDTGIPEDNEDGAETTQTQSPIDLNIAWSVDKIRWDNDFNKLILLKHKDQKIYVKNHAEEGVTCTMQSTGNSPIERIMNLFNFSFLSMPKHGDAWLNKKNAEIIGADYVLTFTGNDKSPKGKAFEQKINVKYCGTASNIEKNLHVKIVDIKEEEI